MYSKTFIINKETPLTLDWSVPNGFQINNTKFNGPFKEFKIMFHSPNGGILWFNPNKKTQITNIGEDDCFPIGNFAFQYDYFTEKNFQKKLLVLNKFQGYSTEDGLITFILWLTESEYRWMKNIQRRK